MRVLLDTHAFLWWITDDQRLSQRARETIARPTNTLFLSAASAWEIAIKAALGRLRFQGNLKSFISRQLAMNGIEPLPVELAHALHVALLPPLHRDPFDRLLVAQAQLEGIPILTADPILGQYEVEVIW